MRGPGPLGHALPPDQPTAVTATPAPQRGHRVQPLLLTVAAVAVAVAAAAATVAAVASGHDAACSELRGHPVEKRKKVSS